MIKPFGLGTFGSQNNQNTVYEDLEAASQHYQVLGNRVAFNNTYSGQLGGVVLDSCEVHPYAVLWKNRENPASAGGTNIVALPNRFYAFFNTGVINDLKFSVLVFVNGRKMFLNESTTAPGNKDVVLRHNTTLSESWLEFQNSSNFGDVSGWGENFYVEVMLLDKNNFTGKASYVRHTQGLTVSTKNLTIPSNPLNYVTLDRFYRNVMIFRNRKYCAPGRTYFWLNSTTLHFPDGVDAGDVFEFYFLNATLKKHRSYTLPYKQEAAKEILLPEHPNTRLKRV
jgi:hypothetical protein